MKKIGVILSAICLFIACENDKKQQALEIKTHDKIEELQWLVGHWENITDLEQSFENWTQENDSTLLGHSFTLIGTDTVFAERVVLKQEGGSTYFTVIAYQQNDNQPITFKMRPSDDGVFTFENPEHDFPSSISYTNPMKDSIHAWIEGKVQGETRKIDFLFKRK